MGVRDPELDTVIFRVSREQVGSLRVVKGKQEELKQKGELKQSQNKNLIFSFCTGSLYCHIFPYISPFYRRRGLRFMGVSTGENDEDLRRSRQVRVCAETKTLPSTEVRKTRH